jgi:hypothetical protein
VKKLEDTGVKVEVFESEGAIHGFFNHPPLFGPALKRMEKFLDENLRSSKELRPQHAFGDGCNPRWRVGLIGGSHLVLVVLGEESCAQS